MFDLLNILFRSLSSLWEMSVTAAYAAAVVIVLRLLLKKRAPKQVLCLLWLVVFARLLIPVSLESPLSIVPNTLPGQEYAAGQAPAGAGNPVVPAEPQNPVQNQPQKQPGNNTVTPMTGGQNPSLSVPEGVSPTAPTPVVPAAFPWQAAITGVWLTGAAVLGGYALVSWLRLRRRLFDAIRAGDGAWEHPAVDSPFILGILRPRIYLPAGLTGQPRQFILCHERAHLRRFDHIVKPVCWTALALHWFNPLAWASFLLMSRDIEAACDEAVVRQLGSTVKADYSCTLLALATGRRFPAPCPLAFDEGDAKGRIRNVLSYRRPAFWAIVISVVAAVLAAVCLLTDPVAAKEPEGDPDPDRASLPPFAASDGGTQADEAAFTAQVGGSRYQISFQLDIPRGINVIGYDDDLISVSHEYWDGAPKGKLNWTDDLPADAQKLNDGTCVRSGLGFYDGSLDSQVVPAGVTYREWYYPIADGALYLCFRWDETDLENAEAVRATLRYSVETLTASPDGFNPAGPALDPASYTLTLNEYGTLIYITGLDCEYTYWHSKPESSFFDPPEHALGVLDIWQPRFLGERFSQYYPYCTALYSPEDNPDLVWIAAYNNDDVSWFPTDDSKKSKELCCTVNLSTGEIINRKIAYSGWENAECKLSNAEMVQTARILAQLIQDASNLYQASLPVPEDGPLPFDVPMKMQFASGAGGWETVITLHPDGSFEGNYQDMDMGDAGPGYQSTEYVCRFHGRFGKIRQVTGASWSLTLEELTLDTGRPVGEEWIEAIPTNGGSYNMRYISSSPYGFDSWDGESMSVPLEPGAQFMFYTPEASGYRPTDELYGFNSANEDYNSIMYRFWTWMPSSHKIGAWGQDTRLRYYALCSMETGYGFFDLKAWGIG